MYKTPMHFILADNFIKDLSITELVNIYDSVDHNVILLVDKKTHIEFNGVIISITHIINRLKELGVEFVSYYSKAKDAILAQNELTKSDTDFLVNLFDNWNGTDLININDVYIHEFHLYIEIVESRKISRCYF